MNFRYLFGMYNRKTLCFDDFVIFNNLDDLKNYYSALHSLYVTGKYNDYDFADFILYPFDYSVFEVGRLDLVPSNPVNCVKDLTCKSCGDFSDLLGLKKLGDDENVERERDDFDSEPVYSSQSPRT